MEPNAPSPNAPAAEDPFRYGSRMVKVERPDGSTDIELVPLTPDDLLRPEEEDQPMHNLQHERDRAYLFSVFRTRPLSPPLGQVTSDQRVNWPGFGVTGLCPDVGVFVGLTTELPPLSATLDVDEFGASTVLLVEIVSPGWRENDVVRKVLLYHDAEVPFYVIVDQEKEGGPRALRAYRWTPKDYVEVPPDPQGRVMLPRLGLLLGLGEERVVCYDATTGAELGDYETIASNLHDARLRLEEADRRYEQQNQAIEEQILARYKAERDSRAFQLEIDRQKQALELAEQQAKERDDAAARRIRDLEALVRSLQAGGAPPPTSGAT